MYEEFSKQATLWLASAIELSAAALIGLAAIQATAGALWVFFARPKQTGKTEGIRLTLGRWLALALEFELAADILRTAVAPTWNEIGQLAAIIILRTALNFFLQREIDHAAKRGRTSLPGSGQARADSSVESGALGVPPSDLEDI